MDQNLTFCRTRAQQAFQRVWGRRGHPQSFPGMQDPASSHLFPWNFFLAWSQNGALSSGGPEPVRQHVLIPCSFAVTQSCSDPKLNNAVGGRPLPRPGDNSRTLSCYSSTPSVAAASIYTRKRLGQGEPDAHHTILAFEIFAIHPYSSRHRHTRRAAR